MIPDSDLKILEIANSIPITSLIRKRLIAKLYQISNALLEIELTDSGFGDDEIEAKTIERAL